MIRKRSRAAAFGVLVHVSLSVSLLTTAEKTDTSSGNTATTTSKSNNKNECVDNPNYVSRFGKLNCEAYRDLDCNGFRDVESGGDGGGSTRPTNADADGIGKPTAINSLADELLVNCPKSCGVDSCEESSTFYWDKFLDDAAIAEEPPSTTGSTSTPPQLSSGAKTKGGMLHQKINGDSSTTGGGISSYKPQHHFPSGCFKGWDPTCRDDPDYRCLNGLGCEAYEDYDCTRFTHVGYSNAQVADLIYHCPCSCEIECGKWEKSDDVLDKFTSAFMPNSAPSAVPRQKKSPGGIGQDSLGIGGGTSIGGAGPIIGKPRMLEPTTITLEGKLFELSMYPMSRSLDFGAIADLSAALDEQIISNIDEIMKPYEKRSIELNTFLLFQLLGGEERRTKRILAEDVMANGKKGESIAIAIDETIFDLLHSRQQQNQEDNNTGGDRELSSFQALHLGIMKIVHVTIPAVGGLYDEALVPDSDTMDLAVLTVFTNLHQSRKLVSRLQLANPRHFSSLQMIEFIGFLKEPTESPSSSPSASPTFAPSSKPTESPTLPPTNIHSDSPSAAPTPSPSHAPTHRPSNLPTFHPTSSPTIHHSDSPSVGPSVAPTVSPTSTPTMQPEDVAVHGNMYEITINPVAGFLDFWAITQLNAVLNGAASANLILPSTKHGKARVKFATALLSQDISGDGLVQEERRGPLTVRVQTTAFVTIPRSKADPSGQYSQHLLPSIDTIDEAIYSSYSGGQEEEVATMLRSSPSKQFWLVSDVSFKRFIYPPTPSPSTNPSYLPSDLPSSSPSVSPTHSPSDFPSVSPTPLPSASPSASPTDRPTTHPSDVPSVGPSSLPSDIPSLMPSLQPSNSPTLHPTDYPTTSPSQYPSDLPSSAPSLSPTVEHSQSPSSLPSDQPSDLPSPSPSDSPTDRPSTLPSSLPSVKPSPSLSASPSSSPTDRPTTQPSDLPSSSPSVSPTHSPSGSPSASPSFSPALVAVEGNVFELSMTPVNTYLYVDAFNEMNSVFDDMILSNLVLPDSSAVTSMEVSTVMSSQGLKRRGLLEDFEPVDLLRIDNGYIGNAHRRTAIGTSSILYVRLQKTLHISVPSIDKGGKYHPQLVPDTTAVDLATSTVFTDPIQMQYFVQRLRFSNVKAFSLLDEVIFSGFMYPPTEAPSAAPSSEPTPAPTISLMPSASPTASPSDHPSASQTSTPSSHPTQHPSPSPSAHPSAAPTMSPTFSPTVSPTNNPTPLHSNAPSLSPSAAPSPSPVTVTVHGHIFELYFSPVQMYLDYEAFTAINYALDDLILDNIPLPRSETRHIEASITLFSQVKTSTNLVASLQLTTFVTVPALKASGEYDKNSFPTASQLDLAVQSVLSDIEQKDVLIARLRASESIHFRYLDQIYLKRFILPPTRAPTNLPTTSPTLTPTNFPTLSPTAPRKIIAVDSSIFDISIAPMQSYLDVAGVTPINTVLDEMMTANLVLPLSSENVEAKVVSIFLSQGLHWTSKSLTIRMQAAAYVTVPDGREDLLPDVDAVNTAIVSVFLNEKQKSKFVRKLQKSGIVAFVELRHAVFLGFYV